MCRRGGVFIGSVCLLPALNTNCFCVVLHLLLCICYIGVGRFGCICNSEYLWMGFDIGFSFLNDVAYEKTLKNLSYCPQCIVSRFFFKVRRFLFTQK